MPNETTEPSSEPSWIVKAGLLGLEAALTYCVILMYEVTPTSTVPMQAPDVIVTPSQKNWTYDGAPLVIVERLTCW